jgi:hypothetical protein
LGLWTDHEDAMLEAYKDGTLSHQVRVNGGYVTWPRRPRGRPRKTPTTNAVSLYDQKIKPSITSSAFPLLRVEPEELWHGGELGQWLYYVMKCKEDQDREATRPPVGRGYRWVYGPTKGKRVIRQRAPRHRPTGRG